MRVEGRRWWAPLILTLALAAPESPSDTSTSVQNVPTTPKYFDGAHVAPHFISYRNAPDVNAANAADAGHTTSSLGPTTLCLSDGVPVLPTDEVALPVPSLTPQKGRAAYDESSRVVTPLSQRRKHSSRSVVSDSSCPSQHSSPESSRFSDEREVSPTQPGTPSPLSQRRKRPKPADGESKKYSGDTDNSSDNGDSSSPASDLPQLLTLSQRRKRTKLTISKPPTSPHSSNTSTSPTAEELIYNDDYNEGQRSSGILNPLIPINDDTVANPDRATTNTSLDSTNFTPNSTSMTSSTDSSLSWSANLCTSSVEPAVDSAEDSTLNPNRCLTSNSSPNHNAKGGGSATHTKVFNSASIANLIHTNDDTSNDFDTFFLFHTRTAPKVERTKPTMETYPELENDVRAHTPSTYRAMHPDITGTPPIDLPSPGNNKDKRKRLKPDQSLAAHTQVVSHRLRSSVRRPSPSPYKYLDPPSPSKSAKRKFAYESTPASPPVRPRTTFSSPHSPEPTSSRSPLPSPPSPNCYPHFPHPPMLTSFSYSLSGSPHRVAGYPSSMPSLSASPSSPQHLPPNPFPIPSISANPSTSVTSPPARKVPCCTRCDARAAWKHDKKGKRWFCKHCKLPFTPGVAPAHQKSKDVITIPPCPKCYSNEGKKQEKGRYFCNHCKRSFRPRIARSTTRSSSRKVSGAASKRADSSEEEEEEEEGEKEDAEEVGDDSDYGTPDVSHFTPDLETDYPYYRGDTKKLQYHKRTPARDVCPRLLFHGSADEEPTSSPWPHAEENAQTTRNLYNLRSNQHSNFNFSPMKTSGDRLQHMSNYNCLPNTNCHSQTTYNNYNEANYHGGAIYNNARGYNFHSEQPLEVEESMDHEDVSQILLEMRGNKTK